MCSFLLFYALVVFNTFFCRKIQWLLPTEVYKQEIIWDCRRTTLCVSYLTTSCPECVVFKCLLTWLCDATTKLVLFNSISLFSYSGNCITSVHSRLSEQLCP